MTRKEKINQLNDIFAEINEDDNAVCYLTSEDNELIKSAIEALEQESQTFEWCTGCREYDQEKHCCHRWSKVIRDTVEEMKQPCEDAISRDDALKLIRNCGRCDDKSAYGTIYHGIEHLPPVQPKIKTGQWFLLDECSNSGYYCSECHKKLVKEGWSGTVKKIKFCPNCGAKMIEPQESEE